MTQQNRATGSVYAAKFAVASLIVAAGALAMATQAGADPGEPYPTPGPSDPAAPVAVPGQPVVIPLDGPVAPAPPPPVGPPTVPEVANPVYGQGQTPGSFGYLRDIWRATRTGDPVGALTAAPQDAPGPPPGAGPPPPLPPGFVSLTAPESSTPAVGYGSGPNPAGPALPPGYYPLNGPPPPGYYDAPPGQDPVAPTVVSAVPAP